MHAGGSYPALGLSVEITPLLLLCGVSAWSLDEQVATRCSLSCFLEVGEGKASPASPLDVVSKTTRKGIPLHGCPGGLYRPTPRGTMVIRLDVGPDRQRL